MSAIMANYPFLAVCARSPLEGSVSAGKQELEDRASEASQLLDRWKTGGKDFASI